MSSNRSDSRQIQPGQNLAVAAEALRNAAPSVDSEEGGRGGERVSVFWRIFGGTLLSIVFLAVLTVWQQFSAQLNDLRGELGHVSKDFRKDLNRFSEGQAELVKKEEFGSRMRSVWDSIKELQADRTTVTRLNERCDLLKEMVKAAEEERKGLGRELQRLRERLASLEGRQTLSTIKPASHQEGDE